MEKKTEEEIDSQNRNNDTKIVSVICMNRWEGGRALWRCSTKVANPELRAKGENIIIYKNNSV